MALDNLVDAIAKEIRRRTVARQVENYSNIKRAAEQYLEGQPYILWANWDISKPERREQAATWLANQVINVLNEMG